MSIDIPALLAPDWAFFGVFLFALAVMVAAAVWPGVKNKETKP